MPRLPFFGPTPWGRLLVSGFRLFGAATWGASLPAVIAAPS